MDSVNSPLLDDGSMMGVDRSLRNSRIRRPVDRCEANGGLDESEIDGLTRERPYRSSTNRKRPPQELSDDGNHSVARANSRRGTTLFGKLITTLATIALFISASAGLSNLAFAEDSPADLERGQQLFEFCTQCHAADGGGDSTVLAPAIAGLPAWYVEMQLKNFKNGIRGLHQDDRGGLRMYPMSLWLREEADQKAVAAYVASMTPVASARELVHPGDAAKGQGYYAVCGACHGADATGNPQMGAPPLVGMSDWYLYSSIQKYKTGIRGNGPGDIYGPAMIGMVATLPDDAAVRDVIAHIQALEKK
jgi:cytochrome c553